MKLRCARGVVGEIPRPRKHRHDRLTGSGMSAWSARTCLSLSRIRSHESRECQLEQLALTALLIQAPSGTTLALTSSSLA